MFEGMMAKRMVIADRVIKETRIDDLFVEDRDIVYFDTLNDAIEKINYYAVKEHERDIIAANGYNKVINNHTQIQRVDTLLNAIRELKK
jgi:spore maturation protein CgeB